MKGIGIGSLLQMDKIQDDEKSIKNNHYWNTITVYEKWGYRKESYHCHRHKHHRCGQLSQKCLCCFYYMLQIMQSRRYLFTFIKMLFMGSVRSLYICVCVWCTVHPCHCHYHNHHLTFVYMYIYILCGMLPGPKKKFRSFASLSVFLHTYFVCSLFFIIFIF